MEKGWHLHDYASPAVLLIALPHGCKALLPPSSGEFNHLVCAPTVIKNVPFKLRSGWRYLKTGRQAEAKAVGYGRLLKAHRWDRLIALKHGVNNVSGFICWGWFFEWLKHIFCMYQHRCAPSHWCTHCTHEAAFWAYWDLGTRFLSKPNWRNFATKSLQLTPFDHLDQDEHQSRVVGMENGETDKLRRVMLKMTPCYAKSHWAQIFMNREKEIINLKTQIMWRVSSLQLEMLFISAPFGPVEYRRCPTSEGTHLRISFSTILMNCSYHQGRNKSSRKANKWTLIPGQSSKIITEKKSSRHQSKDDVIFDTPGCHFSPYSPSMFHVSRNILHPSRAIAKTWEQIQHAVRAFNNCGDHELRPSVIEYWFAHLGFVS